MDKNPKNQLTVKNDISLNEKSPRNLESNKNVKGSNDENSSSVVVHKSPRKSELKSVSNWEINKKNKIQSSIIKSPNRSAGSSPVKSMISNPSVNARSPIKCAISTQSVVKSKPDIIKSPLKITKPEFTSKIVKPVKQIGSGYSINKDIHNRISLIPIKKQKNFTKAEPFQLSHTIKTKCNTTTGIRKKSRTCVDLKSTTDDTSSDFGKSHPSSGRLTARSSGMGILDLPGMKTHRLGEIPKYLKVADKTTLSDNGADKTNLSSKKKTFNNLKKKLCDCQSEFLLAYKVMQEAQTKINKCTGKEQNKTEIIELVAVTTDDGKLLLVKDQSSDHFLKDDKPKLDIEIDLNQNIEIEQKLQNITENGYKLCKDFVNSISKLKTENLNNDGENNSGDKEEPALNTLNVEISEIVTKMQEQMDIALKDQETSLKEIAKILVSQIPIAQPESSPKSSSKLIDQQETIHLKKSLEVYKNKCNKLETNNSELIKENSILSDLQKQLKDKQVTIVNKDVEVQKLKTLNKNADELKHLTDTKNQNLESKLIAKELDLKKIENDLLTAQKRIKSCDDVMDEVKREKEKLFGYVCREQEVSKLYEHERTKCEQLQQELDEKDKQLTKAMIDFDNHKKSSILGAGDRFTQENQLWEEIKTLKLSLENSIKEKESIEIQKNNLEKSLTINNNDSYKMELCKSHEEMAHLQKTNEVLRESLNKMEQTVNRKCGIINELEQKINTGAYLTNTSKEVQNELNILRETDAEKRREIEHLKCEVAKCHIEIKQQEETIYMHQRLLRIRSELINSLQEKEASNRCRMDDLYSEVTKKSTQVNQMNHEISAKAEELQNLFSTLGTKQMELTRQEHIIKMLEENNDRNQRLRVKQEEKICRLENEISELKNIICMYQETKPSLDFKKINGDFLENKSINDLLVSRDLFHNERRKKRQIEIEVKKIKK